jgi:hypothetical protein
MSCCRIIHVIIGMYNQIKSSYKLQTCLSLVEEEKEEEHNFPKEIKPFRLESIQLENNKQNHHALLSFLFQ